MSKWLAVILGTLLVATNVGWLYATLDQGVTLSYREQLLYEHSNRVLALSKIADHFVKGKTREETLQILYQTLPDDEPFEKDGALNTAWISFQLASDGTVRSIERDEYVVYWATPSRSRDRHER